MAHLPVPELKLAIKDVITALGGPAAVAEGLGLPAEAGPVAVRAWIFRGGIPGEWFTDIERLARERGNTDITVETLAALAKDRRLSRPSAHAQVRAG